MVNDALKQIWEKVDKMAGPHRLETETEHIARDMREGRFPERSDRIQVPVDPHHMTHDTPPKRIWASYRKRPEQLYAYPWPSHEGAAEHEYILASHADAMVAAALREAAREVDLRYAEGAMGNPGHYIQALIPQPAAAALDKLIREAEARVRDHAAQIGGDAAVEVLLRHEPDASPLKIQMTRQAIANPIRRAAKGESK